MRQIATLDLKRFRNEEDYGFHTRVLALGNKYLTLESDAAMLSDYDFGVARLDAALKQSSKNSYTAALTAADGVADTLRRYSYMNLRSLTKHPDEEARAIALQLMDIYDKYGDFTDLGYDEEYGRYQNLNTDLENVGTETLDKVHFSPWLAAMKAAVADFLSTRSAKVEEQSQREVGVVKEARTLCDDRYRKMVKRINALIIVNEDDSDYAQFIDQLNVMIAEAQSALKARSTNAGKEDAEGEGE